MLAVLVESDRLKPGPRTDGRPSAKDISDLSLLRAVADFGAEAMDAFIGVPPKVVVAKHRKCFAQGLVTKSWELTAKGALMLREADDEGEIE